MAPRSRPGAVALEINMIIQLLGSRFQFIDQFLNKAQMHLHVSRSREEGGGRRRGGGGVVVLGYIYIIAVVNAHNISVCVCVAGSKYWMPIKPC